MWENVLPQLNGIMLGVHLLETETWSGHCACQLVLQILKDAYHTVD